MEQIKKIIQIDLAEYGMEGVIEMRKPSLRKQNEFKNQVMRYFIINGDEKRLKPDAPVGDLELLMTLQYIFHHYKKFLMGGQIPVPVIPTQLFDLIVAMLRIPVYEGIVIVDH